MQTDIPDILSFAAQPVDRGGRLYQGITLGLGIDLASGRVIPADAAWDAAMKALAPGDCLDMGLPKLEAEWLLAGKACAPGEESVTGLAVDLRVGASARRLLVEDAQPFTALPLDWAHTWGSPDENPTGLAQGQIHRAPVSDRALPFGAPACPGPRGAWPCRMGRMGTYDAAWLATRWPGPPDDFDWKFYNLAQPSQRLPEGITGTEDIEITNMHPTCRRIACRLPGKTLRLQILRQGQWAGHAVNCDTLWLFPNQLAGLLLWHALVACADESGSDIEGLAVTMEPEDPPTASAADLDPAVTAEAQAAEAQAAAAAPSAASAVVGTAAAGPDMPDPAAPAPEAPEPASPPSVAPPQDYAAELNAGLDESLDEINAGLAEVGLPPMSQEQIEETRRRLAAIGEQMNALEQAANAPAPDPLDELRNLGLSESQVQDLDAALNLEPPDPDMFKNAAEWEQAVDGYMDSFSRLLHPSESVEENLRTTLLLQGPGGEALLETLSGGPAPEPTEILVQAGMAPQQATRLLELLDEDIPSDPAGLAAYARQLEAEAGFPPGSVVDRIEAYNDMLRQLELDVPDVPQAPMPEAAAAEAAADAPPPKAAATATPLAPPEAQADAGPAGPPESQADAEPAGPPTDRAGVLRLLAAGGSLAGLTLTGIDLSGLDLSGQDMSRSVLTGAQLAGSRLDNATLAHARLAHADLSGCSLQDCDLTAADLSGALANQAMFINARLDGAVLTGLEAHDADFTETVFDQAVLDNGSFVGATFEDVHGMGMSAVGADFTRARLRACHLPGAVFDQACLADADLQLSALDKASFMGANLAGATFCNGTSVLGGIFTQATFTGGGWTNASARGADFTAVSADGVVFSDCDFTAAVWRAASLREADFSRSVLDGCDMERANLFRASLHEAGLAATRLAGANLYGADLIRAKTNLATNFDGADYTCTILAAREQTA